MKIFTFVPLILAISAITLRDDDYGDDDDEDCDWEQDFDGCCYAEYPEDACDAVLDCMDGEITQEKGEECIEMLNYDDEEECDMIGDFRNCCYDMFPDEACDAVNLCLDEFPEETTEEQIMTCVDKVA